MHVKIIIELLIGIYMHSRFVITNAGADILIMLFIMIGLDVLITITIQYITIMTDIITDVIRLSGLITIIRFIIVSAIFAG